MSKTIDRLLIDHRRVQAVLETITEVCKGLDVEEIDAHADHLFCLVDYLLEYPDQVHHPTEDLVFDKLSELDLSKAQHEKVELNRSQHSALKAATVELMDLIETPYAGIDGALFLQKLEEYVAVQHKHMQFEEQEIFPLALKHIPAADWEVLDERFGETKDPLFDDTDRRYAAIYRLLVPSEDETNRLAEPLLRYLKASGTTL